MTTRVYTSVFDHSSDATFRAWGSELSTNLAAAGLSKTSDSGQINWNTVARPGTVNTSAGYEIWKLPDSSLYFKLEYGTGNASSQPSLWITVATGSDGAGNLTGQASVRTQSASGSAIGSSSLPYSTYICVTNDYFMLLLKQGSCSSGGVVLPSAFFVVGKTVDSTGVSTTQGYAVMVVKYTSILQSIQSIRLASPAQSYAATNWYSLIPGNPTTGRINGLAMQVYPWMIAMPDAQPFLWAGSYILGDIGAMAQFKTAVIGTAKRNYMAIGQTGGGGSNNGGANNNIGSFSAVFVLWE